MGEPSQIIDPVQIIFCNACIVLSKRERARQLKEGRTIEEVKIQRPNPAVTWEPQISAGFPVSVPVCIEHAAFEERSVLVP